MSKEQVIAATKACFEKVSKMYGIDLSGTILRFDITSPRCLGMAGWRGNNYYLRYNPAYFTTDIAYYCDVIIPHEVAHIVCFKLPHLGKNHNPGWKRVCRSLGGTGESRVKAGFACAAPDASQLAVRKVRKARTVYKYQLAGGTIVEMSVIRHRRIMMGGAYRHRLTGERIDSTKYVRG